MSAHDLRIGPGAAKRLPNLAFTTALCLIGLQPSAFGGFSLLSQPYVAPAAIPGRSQAPMDVGCSTIDPGPCNGGLVFAFITPQISGDVAALTVDFSAGGFGSCELTAADVTPLADPELTCLATNLESLGLYNPATQDLAGLVTNMTCTTCAPPGVFESRAFFEAVVHEGNGVEVPIARVVVTTSDVLSPCNIPAECLAEVSVGRCADAAAGCCISPFDQPRCQGLFTQGTLCDRNEPVCEVVPAVSEWGLAAMVLIGLSLGTVVFARMFRVRDRIRG